MLNDNDVISVPVRASPAAPLLLSEAAIGGGVHLDLCCGGNGVCGRCEVEWDGRRVLACQTVATTESVVRIPRSSLVPAEWVVESAFAPPFPRPAHPRCRRLLVRVPEARELDGLDDWARLCRAAFGDGPRPGAAPDVLRGLPALAEDGRPVRLTVLDDRIIELVDADEPPQRVLGAAIDAGTTTVVVRLLDLITGEELALAGAQNRQVSLGASVINRIVAGSTPDGLDRLRNLVAAQTIAPLLDQCLAAAGLAGVPVRRAAVAGNTTMLHLLLGLSPKGLGTVPFNAVTLNPEPVAGAALGLPVETVEPLASAAAYIGADVVGGVYSVGMDRPGPPAMLIDVGTNSEILLRVDDRIFATSAAAGPAFEGAGLTSGGPATPGAIAHLHLDDSAFAFQTCRHAAPTHLCGSAYVDFLAEGRNRGFLTERGRLAQGFALAETYEIDSGNGGARRTGRRCRIAGDAAVSEQDVSLLLQAKAAILAASTVLMRVAGITAGDLRTLHVAGGFGRHLNPDHALRIGLLPPVPRDRIHVVGNTSLAAASGALLNARALPEIRALAARVRVVELNREPDFEDTFISALALQ